MIFQEYITTKNVIFFILILITLVFISQIKAIAMLFFASYIIACSLNPLVDKLAKKMKRSLATTIVLLGTMVVSFACFIPIILVAIEQIKGFVNALPEQLKLLENFILTHEFYGHKLSEFINLESIIKSSSPFASGVVNQSINLTLGITQGIIFLLAIFMIVFYILADKDEIKKSFISIFPEKIKDRADLILQNISHKVGGYVIAQILNMIAIGLITALALFLIKVDYALLLGLITGVLDIIPIIGPTIALGLCLIMCYQMGPVGIALVITAFLTAQWASNNLVRPVVFGRFLDLHPLVIIFSLLVAAQFLGVWGVILAPAIAAIICVLFDEIYLKTVNDGQE